MAKQQKRPPEADGGVAAPRNSGDRSAAPIDRERIEMRAYELYRARGGSDGRDMDDWFAAEREVVTGSGRYDDEV